MPITTTDIPKSYTLVKISQSRIEYFANFQPARFPSNVFNAQSSGHGACGSKHSCGKQIKSVHLCAISCTRVCMCHVCCSCVAVRNVKYIRAEMPLICYYVSFWPRAADKTSAALRRCNSVVQHEYQSFRN